MSSVSRPAKATATAELPAGASRQRTTRQRSAVANVLQDVDDFQSAQALHDLLKERGENIGLTTVYRSLQAMVSAGDIDVLVRTDGETLYRRCGQRAGHHHHLVCRDCGLTVEVEGPAVERWTHAVAKEHGFSDVSHTMDIFGVCPACAKKALRQRT